MRNQWLRLLLLRCHAPSQPCVSQVHHLRSFTSAILQPRAPHVTPKPFPLRHHFTSSPETAVDPPKPLSDEAVLLLEAFAKSGSSNDEIKLDLVSKKLSLTDDLIFGVVSHPDTDADVAERIYAWVLESQNETLSSRIWDCIQEGKNRELRSRVWGWFWGDRDVKLRSKSYNLLLKLLVRNWHWKDALHMIYNMKSIGYGVSKGAFIEFSELSKYYEMDDSLRELEVAKLFYTISNRVRREVWGDDLEKQLRELDTEFYSALVSNVLRHPETDPNKALIFLSWLEGNDLIEHDSESTEAYNAMARVLSKQDHTQNFWRFVNEQNGEWRWMEWRDTYVHILGRFVKRKMIKDAVDLYALPVIAWGSWDNPSRTDCILLLKKIVVGEELDMDLFSKVLRVFKAGGKVLTDSHLDSVIKSLISVGKMTECNKILLAMEEHGYVPSRSLRSKIAFKLSKAGKTNEAREFMDHLTSCNISDSGTWVSLVKGYCEARNLEEASRSFREMVEREGASCGGQALDLLVGTYCRKNKPFDAYKFVAEMVYDKGLSPWNATYKTLTSKLLAKKYFKEAIDVMAMMKNQDYAPDLDSFVKYLSKKGSAEDAIVFSQAMTSKRFPSTTVFLRLFDAYIKAGRESEGQDFLSKCPSYIRNHADVLDLFYSRKSRGAKIEALAV